MGRELQKRKRRSSRATVRQPTSTKKPLNPMGNSIIAKNWNKKQTLSQNYRRLGLVAKLGGATGGVEPDFLGTGDGNAGAKDGASAVGPANKKGPRRDPFAVTFAVKPMAQQIVTEARVERDASGRIVRVLDGRRENPLRDPLVQFDSDSEAGEEEAEDAEEWGGIDEDEEDEDESRPSVVMELERQAGRPLEKRLRHTSRGEGEWLERLVARHGDDAAAMARDRKLNPMQQTEADISRRLRRWRAGSGKA